MTTTDLAGLPAEIAAVLARAGLAQDAACELAGIPRTSYYRRKTTPGAWQVGELIDFLATADVTVRVELGPLVLGAAPNVRIRDFRLGELSQLAGSAGVTLRLELGKAVPTSPDQTVAGLGGLSG